MSQQKYKTRQSKKTKKVVRKRRTIIYEDETKQTVQTRMLKKHIVHMYRIYVKRHNLMTARGKDPLAQFKHDQKFVMFVFKEVMKNNSAELAFRLLNMADRATQKRLLFPVKMKYKNFIL
mgnify:CR=1 FL=1